jgi:hypothetical protein
VARCASAQPGGTRGTSSPKPTTAGSHPSRRSKTRVEVLWQNDVVIKLKVVIQAPPSGVAFALQKGKGAQGSEQALPHAYQKSSAEVALHARSSSPVSLRTLSS